MKKLVEQLSDIVEVSVQVVEHFKKMTGYSAEEFTQYMNTYNIWSLLNDTNMIIYLGHEGEDAILRVMGRYLSAEKRTEIISRNRSIF